MITSDCIELAYCLLHQKWRVYEHSDMDWQRDDIEQAVAAYTREMNTELYDLLAQGQPDFLTRHTRFVQDMHQAIECLENMMS